MADGERRRVLLSLLGLMAAGCSRSPATFHSADITGSSFATGFELSDPDGRTRTLADFKDRCVLIFFGFTQCPDVCPTAPIRAAEIKRLLAEQGSRLQVIFVTLDPERDSPAVMRQYPSAFDPDFLGLRGSLQQTQETAKAFKIYFEKVPTQGTYTLNHSSVSYAYDPAGKVRLAIPHSLSAKDCAEDLQLLMRA